MRARHARSCAFACRALRRALHCPRRLCCRLCACPDLPHASAMHSLVFLTSATMSSVCRDTLAFMF